MYSQALGEAYNYGQPPNQSGNNSPTRFLDYQINTFGMPRRQRRQQQQQQPQAQPGGFNPQQPQPQQSQQPMATGVPFMPSGQPMPAPLQQGDPRLGQQGSVNQQGVYTPGTAPQFTYNPVATPAFVQPQTRGIEQLQAQQIAQMLQSGGSMNPQIVAQMQGQLADQAALMQQQNIGQSAQSLALRGVGNQSGQFNANARDIRSNTANNLLDQYRQLNVAAAQQNQQDMLNNLGAADSFQGNLLSRAIGGFNANLSGQAAESNQQQAFLNSLYDRYGMQEDLLSRQSQSQLSANQQGLQQQQINQSGSQFYDELEYRYRLAQQQQLQNYLNLLFSGSRG